MRIHPVKFIAAIVCLVAIGVAPYAAAEVDRSQVDQTPLKTVKVVEAFPNLQWPDEATGADEGKPKELRPIVVTGAGDGSGRLFIATQPGRIHVIENDPKAEEMKTFLDITDRVASDIGLGLLGMAFHPDFNTNGYFVVSSII